MRKYKGKVKLPWLAWLLDRGIIFIIVAALIAIPIAKAFSSGINSFRNMTAETEEESPYQEVSPSLSLGLGWASEFITNAPPSVSQWSVSDSTKPVPMGTEKTCKGLSTTPTSLLGAVTASGDKTETIIQVYGAGQARTNFDSIIKIYENCGMTPTSIETDNGAAVQFDNTVIITMGDMILQNVSQNVTANTEYYLSTLPESLTASGCVSLTVPSSSFTRSFYYDAETYTGLIESQEVGTEVDLSGLPTPTNYEVININFEGMTVPESPLPDGFPTMPEKTPEKPSIPTAPETVTNFAGEAKYQVADIVGPGCGWEWSGQLSPSYNDEQLITQKDDAIEATQIEVNDNATQYVNNHMSWAQQFITLLPQINTWNAYANKVNSVHEKWAWLEEQRAQLKDSWYQYIEDYNNWKTFDTRKAEALKTYEDELKACKTKQDELTKWEEQYGTTTSTDTDTGTSGTNNDNTGNTVTSPNDSSNTQQSGTIPTKPEGCTTIPTRPAILDEMKPSEPQPPTIPTGVTIPDSWPKVS